MADITAPEYISPYVVTTSGGLVLDRDVYTMPVGAASILQNFEPSVRGGYRRLSGTSKFRSNVVSGTGTILGVSVFNNGVVAAQGTAVYFGTTSSDWSSIDSGRTSAGRYRFEKYNFSTNEERLIYVDGANYASVYNGSTILDIKGDATNVSTTGTISSGSTSLSVGSASGIVPGMYVDISLTKSPSAQVDIAAVTHSPSAEIVTGSTIFTVSDASNLVAGMAVSGTGIDTGTTISEVNSNTVTLSKATTATIATSVTLSFVGKTSFTVSSNTGLVVGMMVFGTGIASGTKIAAISSGTITLDKVITDVIPTSATLTFRTVSAATTVSSISGTTVTLSSEATNAVSSVTVVFDGLGTAPSDPSMVAAFKNHMFYAGMSATPNTIQFSATNDENDFSASNGAGSLNVDSTIIALKSFRDDLIIFCEDRIYKITGSSLLDFTVSPISRNVGCSDGFSVQEIGGDVIFLAPDGLRTIAGTARIGDVELGTVSKQIQARISDIGFTNISSVVIRDKSQYRLFYPSGGAESSEKGIIGVLKSNPSGQIGWEYSDIRGIKPACCDSGFISGVEKVIHGGFDGYVYLQESGNTFNGTAMKAIYRSPDLTMGDAGIRKSMQRINVNYDPEGSVNASLFVKYDFEDAGTPQPSAYTLSTADTAAVYDNSGTLYGSAVYDAEGMPIVRQSVEGSGFTVVIRLEDESSNPPITLKGFELEFTPGARM